MDTYDDYGQPDIFSNLSNPEHALQTPNALLLSATQNIFMYEHEYNAPNTKHDTSASSHLPNIFEFPNAEEMAELGCSPLVDSCWPETPLLAGSLDGSLNESGMCFSWELSDDEQDEACQMDGTSFCSAPTLAELNMEDSQSTDTSMGLKRKLEGEDGSTTPSVAKVLSGHQEMSLSPQSWKRVKTEAAEMESAKSLARMTSQRKGSLRKPPRTKPPRLILSKPDRTQTNVTEVSVKIEKEASPLAKIHPSKIDFAALFLKHHRSESIPSPTKEMTRSEFIARTPNPFGNRRFLGRNALLKTRTQSNHQPHPLPKVSSSSKALSRSAVQRSPPRTASRAKARSRTRAGSRITRSPSVPKKPMNPISLPAVNEPSQERLWKDLKQFMYSEATSETKNSPHRTSFLPEPHVKSESSKSPRTSGSSDPGFDSHDEGLGSENEDHDDFVSDDDDDDIPDDVSDLSDDPGLPSTSTKSKDGVIKEKPAQGAGSSFMRRRRVKTRRSEYDDFTPNPRKLLHIGHELNKLNLTISGLSPGNEASTDEKNQTRREKNKLASRACRLKKKAQHEANKVKLWGLAEEAKQLKSVLKGMREEMVARVENPKACWDYSLGAKMDHLIKTLLGHMVAGHTSEFVNSVLEKTAKGIPLTHLKRATTNA